MKNIFLILFNLMIGQLFAQSFYTEFDLGREEELSATLELSNGNVIVAIAEGSQEDPNFMIYEDSWIFKLNNHGAVIDSIKIIDFIPIQIKLLDSAFYIYGITPHRSSNSKVVIYKIDSQLTVLDTFQFNYPDRDLARTSTSFVINDSAEIVIPISTSHKVTRDYTQELLKVDVDFNSYSLIKIDSLFYSLITAIDYNQGNYYYSNVVDEHYNLGFFKFNEQSGIDTIEDKLTLPIFNPFFGGDSMRIGYMSSICNFKNKMVIGGMIFNGYIENIENDNSINGFGYDYGVILYDSTLNRLNYKVIGVADTSDFIAFNSIVCSEEGFYVFGTKNWSNVDLYEPIASYIRVSHFDWNGDSIEERLYSNGAFMHAIHMEESQSGGLILSGSTYDSLNAQSTGLNAFLLKIDSLGNLESTGIEDNTGRINKTDYIIYPNPAKNHLNLLKVNQFKPYEFELYDAFGRLVKTVAWREDHQTVDVSSLASGMYVYRIIDEEGNVGSGKLVVE